jgi:hypothetical protein
VPDLKFRHLFKIIRNLKSGSCGKDNVNRIYHGTSGMEASWMWGRLVRHVNPMLYGLSDSILLLPPNYYPTLLGISPITIILCFGLVVSFSTWTVQVIALCVGNPSFICSTHTLSCIMISIIRSACPDDKFAGTAIIGMNQIWNPHRVCHIATERYERW